MAHRRNQGEDAIHVAVDQVESWKLEAIAAIKEGDIDRAMDILEDQLPPDDEDEEIDPDDDQDEDDWDEDDWDDDDDPDYDSAEDDEDLTTYDDDDAESL